MDIISIIREYISKAKGTTIMEGQSKYLKQWQDEYAGYSKDFHDYTIYLTSGQSKQLTRKSFKGAKMVSSDWANLIANEKMNIEIKDNDQDKLQIILDDNNFRETIQIYYELAMALSMSASIITINGITTDQEGKLTAKTGTPKISFLKATQIYPISIENKEITECAFGCDNTRYVDLIIYLKDDTTGEYTIHSLRCEKTSSDGLAYPLEANKSTFETGSKYAWFTIYQPAIANNLDINSDLPISIFANSIDTLHSLDMKYDGFDQEFQLGKRRIFVDADYTKTIEVPVTNADGSTGTESQYVNTFDPNDMVFYQLPKGRGEQAKNGIVTSAEPLRSEEYIRSINQELTYLSKQCGFGTNRYIFESGGRPIQTATGVISQQSELYQNLKKHENLLEKRLKKFILALLDACNKYTEYQFGEYTTNDIKVSFDDSIIEDTNAEQERDRNNVVAGLMSEEDFVGKWYGKTDDDAKEYVLNNLRWKKINNYLQALQTGAITPQLYIKYAYPDIQEGSEEYNNLLAYVEEAKKSAESLNEFSTNYIEQ